jgi:hypothetical protein
MWVLHIHLSQANVASLHLPGITYRTADDGLMDEPNGMKERAGRR